MMALTPTMGDQAAKTNPEMDRVLAGWMEIAVIGGLAIEIDEDKREQMRIEKEMAKSIGRGKSMKSKEGSLHLKPLNRLSVVTKNFDRCEGQRFCDFLGKSTVVEVHLRSLYNCDQCPFWKPDIQICQQPGDLNGCDCKFSVSYVKQDAMPTRLRYGVRCTFFSQAEIIEIQFAGMGNPYRLVPIEQLDLMCHLWAPVIDLKWRVDFWNLT
jgi:hypothetical protein